MATKTYKQLITEMAARLVPEVEKDIAGMFRQINISVRFTKHFEDRITDGNVDKSGIQRGDSISADELIAAFKKLKDKHDVLMVGDKHRSYQEMEGVIKDTFTMLNIPFTLKFDRKTGRFVLSLLTVMKKNSNFHAKPADVVVQI